MGRDATGSTGRTVTSGIAAVQESTGSVDTGRMGQGRWSPYRYQWLAVYAERTGFHTRPVQVKLAVGKVARRQIFTSVFLVPSHNHSTKLIFLFGGEGPHSRRYGRTAALTLIVQPCDEDGEKYDPFFFYFSK
jgi:hypothetical protein